MADQVRVATYNVELSRKGPGLLLRDILKRDADDVQNAANIIAHIAPDVLLITGFDFDPGLHAASEFRALLRETGLDLPYIYSSQSNRGLPSGVDLDGDGRVGGPDDAFGWGRFPGQNGMVLYSALKFDSPNVRDFTQTLWADSPRTLIREDEHKDIRRLSTGNHWIVPLVLADGTLFDIFAWHATPPVFDGPEDLNGRRNHDEAAFWLSIIDQQSDDRPFVLLGDANLDPQDGDGLPEALNQLLAHPSLQDGSPSSLGGAEAAKQDGGANLTHTGNPALDTANWRDMPGPGNLRVDYVLASSHWRVVDAGVFWPDADDPASHLFSGDSSTLSRHHLVWLDLVLKR